MQIYEVRNDIADILYSTEEKKLFLSDFLYIEDKEQTIIAQIKNISTTEKAGTNLVSAKFYLSVDKNNKLTPYNGHIPSKNSRVGYVEPKEILGLFEPKSGGIYWGNYKRNPKIKISADVKFLSANTCIICSKADSSKKIIQNIVSSLNSNSENSIVLDFDGKYDLTDAQNKLSYGKDFRIPLDVTAFDYILNNELEELPTNSKAIIQNTILEVGKYIETLPDGFISFDIFAQIVEQEFKNSKDVGLLIFSNKLEQYRQKKLFANKKTQFDVLNGLKGLSVINISNVKSNFHKLILNSLINLISEKFYVISDVSEESIDNDLIKQIYEKNNITFVPVCSHENPFLQKIKQYCNNFAVFSSPDKTETNEDYKSFISGLSADDFILYGKNTLSVPVTVTMNNSEEDDENNNETISEDIITTEDLDDLEKFIINKNNQNQNQIDDLPNITEQKTEVKTEIKTEKITENIPQSKTPDNSVKNENKHATEKIIEDLFQESKGKIEFSPKEKNAPILEKILKEEHTRDLSAQNAQKQKPNAVELPVYTPKEPPVQKEFTELKEGNRVSHAKYGAGVVEKVMKYGNKTLCCIQFEETGRKLLNPSVTLIEKLL